MVFKLVLNPFYNVLTTHGYFGVVCLIYVCKCWKGDGSAWFHPLHMFLDQNWANPLLFQPFVFPKFIMTSSCFYKKLNRPHHTLKYMKTQSLHWYKVSVKTLIFSVKYVWDSSALHVGKFWGVVPLWLGHHIHMPMWTQQSNFIDLNKTNNLFSVHCIEM